MTIHTLPVIGLLLSVSTGCGSPPPPEPGPTIRGQRYCEVLVGGITNGTAKFDVYNTFGLNDCPQDQWSKLTDASVQAESGTMAAKLNGPRLWTQDAFADAQVIDPTPRTFGGIAMQLDGRVSVPIADVIAGSSYVLRPVSRSPTTIFQAGKPVYELVDPQGSVYTMQSLSQQVATDLTLDTLPSLANRLKPPAGWSFRTRTLDHELRVVASGTATVMQDELIDTYIKSTTD